MIRTAIIDDHSVFLAGLKYVLELEGDIQVVASSEDAGGIVRFWEKARADVVLLLDIRMPGVSGLDALRELSILQYAAKGYSNPEIGESLGISVNSVKTHMKHIFEKLDVNDRMEAVTAAISRGIL